jgi:hypothetical protein
VSSYEKYNPALFVLEKQAGHTTSWVPLTAATFAWSLEYDPDENGTLIYQRETATVSMQFWGSPVVPLHCADRVRAKYHSSTIFEGIVESTSTEYEVDDEAKAHGETLRATFSASCIGKYAAALERQVCWLPVTPPPNAIDFIREYVTVENW